MQCCKCVWARGFTVRGFLSISTFFDSIDRPLPHTIQTKFHHLLILQKCRSIFIYFKLQIFHPNKVKNYIQIFKFFLEIHDIPSMLIKDFYNFQDL